MKILSKECAVRFCALAFHMLQRREREGSRYDLDAKMLYKIKDISARIVRRDLNSRGRGFRTF